MSSYQYAQPVAPWREMMPPDDSTATSDGLFQASSRIMALQAEGRAHAANASNPFPLGWTNALNYYDMWAVFKRPGAPASLVPEVVPQNQTVGAPDVEHQFLWERGDDYGPGHKPMQSVLDLNNDLFDHLWMDPYDTACLDVAGLLPPQGQAYDAEGQERPNSCLDQLPERLGGHTMGATLIGISADSRARGLDEGTTMLVRFHPDCVTFTLKIQCPHLAYEGKGTYKYTRGYSTQDGELSLFWDPASNPCPFQNRDYREFPTTLRTTSKYKGIWDTTAGRAEFRLTLPSTCIYKEPGRVFNDGGPRKL